MNKSSPLSSCPLEASKPEKFASLLLLHLGSTPLSMTFRSPLEKRNIATRSSPVIVALFVVLALSSYSSAYAWSSSPVVTSSVDSSGNTILTIAFDFYDMAYRYRGPLDDGSHHGLMGEYSGWSGDYPNAFQVRTSTDGVSWTTYAPTSLDLGPKVPYEPYKVPTTVTVTYNLGVVRGTLWVQARLQDSGDLGWSAWGPAAAVSIP